MKLPLVCGLAAASLALPAFAADHTNLEEGLPTQIEDAYPLGYRGREAQALLRYERTEEGGDRLVLDPRLELGIARNAQLKFSLPVFLGSADRSNSGDLGIEGFYNFNQESLWLPALAASLRADLPTGKDSAGVDTTWKLLATKTLGKSALFHQLHLNVGYRHNAEREPGERREHYSAALGYSVRLGPDTLLVADVLREQEKKEGKAWNMLELGVRRQLTPLTVVGMGLGAGISEDAPELRLNLAFQHAF